jgi:DNA topoisomerase-2
VCANSVQTPWYKYFTGTIMQVAEDRFVCNGEVATLGNDTLEITELPVKAWTQVYREKVMEAMLEDGTIRDYSQYHSDQTVKFVVKMAEEKLTTARTKGLHAFFKLQNIFHTSSMVLFDANGVLRKVGRGDELFLGLVGLNVTCRFQFNTPEEICQDFFDTRKEIYKKRKDFLEGMLNAQSGRLSEQARFILMKINNEIKIENKRKAAGRRGRGGS